MIDYKPEILVQYIRDNLVEQEHFGFVVVADRNGIIKQYGKDNSYPFYLRSCAKPLQASLLIDFNTDTYFDMTDEEIALCCASHAGEKVHTDIARKLLKKIGLGENDLKCGLHSPLSKSEQNRMLLDNIEVSTLHNNCSGKHIMMLSLCVQNGWDIKNYDDINHPLQKLIKNKIYDLCEVNNDYPITSDGCGVPIFAMPLYNMLKGYLNLFCDEKYAKIKNAFLNCPYVIGGEDRTDTKIMMNCENLIAKVGACGLCIVVNTKDNQGFIVKISDSNMNAREILAFDLINKLSWSEFKIDKSIQTLHSKKVGEIVTAL